MFLIEFGTVVALLLTGVTHGMRLLENFDFRCSEMLCNCHVFVRGKMTSARGLGSNVQNIATIFQCCGDVVNCGLLTGYSF